MERKTQVTGLRAYISLPFQTTSLQDSLWPIENVFPRHRVRANAKWNLLVSFDRHTNDSGSCLALKLTEVN